MFKHDCKVKGHKYEARYDLIPPVNIDSIEGDSYSITEFIKSVSKKIYIYDICVKCGNVIKRG